MRDRGVPALYPLPPLLSPPLPHLPPKKINFEKGIHSTILKLLKAVHSSLAEILICQLSVNRCFGISMAAA